MDKEKLYILVKKSPELVKKHDREGWLNLFSSDAIVEDPVGAGLNRKGKDWRNGKDGLGRFYDIFIAPNDIEFTVKQDIIIGTEVARDVVIRSKLPNGAVLETPAYLVYWGIEENGELKLASMQAHWEFIGSSKTLFKNNGMKGAVAAIAQFRTMIKIQGLKRVQEYLGAIYNGILKKGKTAVKSLVTAANARDKAGFDCLFDAGTYIEFPAGNKISANEFLDSVGKNMRLEISGLRSAGWYTSGVFNAIFGEAQHYGLAFFSFDPRSRKIVSARFFWS